MVGPGSPGLRRFLLRLLLSLALLAGPALHATQVLPIGAIGRLEALLYDALLRRTAPGGIDERIVILDIDEKSLAHPQLGRWPWDRDEMGLLVQRLFDDYGIAALGFDVVHAEPDRGGGAAAIEAFLKAQPAPQAALLGQLERTRDRYDRDAAFAQALRGRPVVLGYYLNSAPDAPRLGALPAPVVPASALNGSRSMVTSWRGWGANLPRLHEAAAAAGHFNALLDSDGVTRRVPVIAEIDGAYYESMTLALARLVTGGGEVVPVYAEGGAGYRELERIDAGAVSIPVDRHGAALVPFRGPERSFSYVSLADVRDGRASRTALEGRIALVGTSAPGLLDLRTTPVGPAYPGVEVHANLLAGMLDQTLLRRPAFMTGVESAVLLAGGAVLTLGLPLVGPLAAIALTLATVGAGIALSVGLWTTQQLVLPFAALLVAAGLLFAFHMSWGYLVESRRKRQVTALFGQYVPPELVDEMARDPSNYSMEGRSAELTVMFSDIRGFTTISERLPPRELAAFINEYLTSMSLQIRQHKGTLDKYIGDAIMAFWGAPVPDARHAAHAVEAALAMQTALGALNTRCQERGWPGIAIGIGLNTGTMSVGDMGSRLRRAYTVMGDAVNLGSRLEGLTKRYGVCIMAGETTQRAADGYAWRELDRVRVKGKIEPVAVFEPLGRPQDLDAATQTALAQWHEALAAYRAQRWDEAEALIGALRCQAPDSALYALYAERVQALRARPPGADWDGVTAFDEK